MQARIPEETLRRLIPPTVQVPTDGISQVVDANNRELRQTMRDTLQATFDISQENLREQARQSGIIGYASVQHNQGRMQDAERMAAVTAQLAEVVNRLPNVPTQLVTNIANLDQRTQNQVVDNRQYQANLTDARNTINTDARSSSTDARQIGARQIYGRIFVDARQTVARQFDARQLDGRTFVDARQTDARQIDARQIGARQFADNRITQTDARQTDARPFADNRITAVDQRQEALFVDARQAAVVDQRQQAVVLDQRTQMMMFLPILL